MTTFYSAPTVLALVLCALVVGACFGWLVRGATTPKQQHYKPFMDRGPNYVVPPLRTQMKPAAPPKPLWEEDPFFAHPDDQGKKDDIEHVTGNVVSMTQRPVAAQRAMG